MVRHYAGFEAGLWYVQESAEGATPSSASFLNLAHKATVAISSQAPPVIIAKSGDVDNTGAKKGVDTPVATITFNPSTANGQAFIKNFISTDNSFTLLCMIDDTADVIFARITGCKVKRISPAVELYPSAGALNVTVEIWGFTILYTASTGSPTFEASPATFVNWTDITIEKATSVITDWWNFNWSLENDLFRSNDDNGVCTAITRGRRRVTGDWTRSSNATVGVGDTELDEQKNATAIDLEFHIGSDEYHFDNVAYTEVEVEHPITALVGIRQTFEASTFSVV
jgi:hypothetical protein